MLGKWKKIIGRANGNSISVRVTKSKGAAKVVYFKDAADKWRWSVIASNGKKLCTPGESFSSKSKAEKNFKRVEKYFKTGV
jgi:uncharacterized protein YegP (UPF0339 family)